MIGYLVYDQLFLPYYTSYFYFNIKIKDKSPIIQLDQKYYVVGKQDKRHIMGITIMKNVRHYKQVNFLKDSFLMYCILFF